MHRLFGITEVFDCILCHLSPEDLARCCQVCKAWCHVCIPRLWRRITPSQWSDTRLVHVLPKYLLHIQEILCDPFDSLEVLVRAGKPAARLTVLSAPLVRGDSLNTTLWILEKHLMLQSLSLQFGYTDTAKNQAIVDRVIRLKHLRHLSLTLIRVMDSTVRFLLKNSPALESLELVRFWESWHIGMSDPLYHTKQRHRDPADTWTSKSRLKTLKIAGFHYDFDTLLKITRFTPHLRSLVLSDTEVPFFLNVSAQNTSMIAFCSLIQEHCPKLDQLTLEQSECIDAKGFKALLDGMPRDLKSFTATREGDPEHKLWRIDNLKFTFEKHLEDLSRFQGLETLKINHTKTLTFVNKDVLQLFPNLKTLELPHTTLRIQDMLEAAPWACNKSLVVLNVRILGPRGWAPVKDTSRRSQNLERGEETSTQLGKTLGLYGRWTALLKTMPLLDCKAVIYIESD